jgi:hypothetical protein
MLCPNCDSNNTAITGQRGNLTEYQCMDCAYYWIIPTIADEEIAAYYYPKTER